MLSFPIALPLSRIHLKSISSITVPFIGKTEVNWIKYCNSESRNRISTRKSDKSISFSSHLGFAFMHVWYNSYFADSFTWYLNPHVKIKVQNIKNMNNRENNIMSAYIFWKHNELILMKKTKGFKTLVTSRGMRALGMTLHVKRDLSRTWYKWSNVTKKYYCLCKTAYNKYKDKQDGIFLCIMLSYPRTWQPPSYTLWEIRPINPTLPPP